MFCHGLSHKALEDTGRGDTLLKKKEISMQCIGQNEKGPENTPIPSRTRIVRGRPTVKTHAEAAVLEYREELGSGGPDNSEKGLRRRGFDVQNTGRRKGTGRRGRKNARSHLPGGIL